MRFFFALLKMSLTASISNRGAFLLECGLMIGNNLLFFSIWGFFFRQFKEVAGWTFHELILLFTIGSGAFGLMQICFGGVRLLSKRIVEGGLDPLMTQPQNLLVQVLSCKSYSKGWGHLLTAFLLILFGKLYAPLTLFLLVLGMLTGALLFTSINLIAHSLPFWLGSVEGLSKKYSDMLYLFSLYPTNIYSGVVQLLLFTVIPAGLINYVPVELIRAFSWNLLLLQLLGTLFVTLCAIALFYKGLKRYESGSLFSIRG